MIRSAKAGFTLIELAIVICIIAILAAIGVMNFGNNVANAEGALINSTGSQIRSATAMRIAETLSTDSLDLTEYVSDGTTTASDVELVTLPSQCTTAIAADNITMSCTKRETTFNLDTATGDVTWTVTDI
ncbi:MAG: prepilin-type N-terminal cleavage/methylation domain-containing protein [Vampirovibrionales bacterium]